MKKFTRLCTVLLCITALQSCLNFQDINYKTKGIKENAGCSFPSEHHIDGVTWIATEKSYCIPTCLQMIGEYNGINEPIEYYTWLSAFSYGCTWKDSFVSFMPISDAMRGLMFASGYLGLERNLFGTSSEEDYIASIKNALSRDNPVMIMYDYNVMTDDTFFFPHAAVITGYSEDSFYYYEPGFHTEFTMNAGHGKKAD